MIYGIGTDICDIRRIRAALERPGERFARTSLATGAFAHGQARTAPWPPSRLRNHDTPDPPKEPHHEAMSQGLRTVLTS